VNCRDLLKRRRFLDLRSTCSGNVGQSKGLNAEIKFGISLTMNVRSNERVFSLES
jgi:hypothetical protein